MYFCNFLSTFFYEQKNTHERSVTAIIVSFAKGFSKHPYILAIFKVDSEYLRFPFKVKVDYFILYTILVCTFVIFLLLFSMNKRRCTDEAENTVSARAGGGVGGPGPPTFFLKKISFPPAEGAY